MRRSTLATLLLAVAPLASSAQELQPYRGHGYLFWGVGQQSGGGQVQQAGFGAEGFLYKGLGATGEIGYMYPPEACACGFGLASLNGSYHFNRARFAKLSPFVTGGYSLAFRGGSHENLYNIGGGVTWWMAQRVGLRLEIRDYVWAQSGSEHTAQFRVALSFR